MRRFLHDRQRRLEERLADSSAALQAYLALNVAMPESVLGFLDRTAAQYRALGDPDAENEMLALEAQLSAAHRGLNTETLELVPRGRREYERAVALQVLLAGAARLRTDLVRTGQLIDQAQERLSPIVCIGLQKGLLSPSASGQYRQAELEAAWQSLLGDPDLRAPAQQLAMGVTVADILLLLADLLTAVRPAPGGTHADSPRRGGDEEAGAHREANHVSTY